MNPTISKMQQDLEKFRASKMGGGSASSSAPVNPAPVTQMQQPTAPSGIQQELEKYRSGKATTGYAVPTSETEPSILKEMVKGIFSAPTTMVARPFQAVAGVAAKVAGKDLSNEEIDTFSQNIPVIGGLIADTPKNYGDIKKDVGRAAQTVALGTGAPIAGGALFGAGASLEQGNDLLSTETAFNAATGGAAGKVLQLVGKPLFNAAGKVIGVITPQTLKNVAAGGAQAIQRFMDENKLANTITAPTAPLANKVASGLQSVDDAIVGGASRVASKTGEVLKNQYPEASIQKYFDNKNRNDIIRPTTVNEPKYSKATNVYNDAKSRGVDIEKIASRRGVIHDKIAESGKYNSRDHADTIRANVYQAGNDITRPALKALEPETRLVSISELRNAMVRQIDDIPRSQITDDARLVLRNKILKRYADNGPTAQANPNGLSLTALHDARIISGKNGKYKPGGTSSDALAAQQSREEGFAYSKILDSKLPKEFRDMRRSNEEDFLLADYLESLHGKTVPEGITGRAARLFGRAATATVGGKIGGFPGAILGAQYGDMLFGTFQALPNPIKIKVLESIKLESPQAYKQLVKLLGDKEMARLSMLKLPAAGESAYRPESKKLFATKKGVVTADKQLATDVASVEEGKAKIPKTSPYYKQKVKEINDRLEQYLTPEEMAIIQMGPKPKPKNTGLPTVTDTPNVYVNIQNKLDKYLTPEEMEIIDWGPKPKRKLFNGPTINIDE